MQKMSPPSSSVAAVLISAGLLCVMGSVAASAAKKRIRIRANISGGVTEVKTPPAKKAKSQKASHSASRSISYSHMINRKK